MQGFGSSRARARLDNVVELLLLFGGMMPLTTLRKLTVALAAGALLVAGTSASAFTKPPFPRIGGIDIGSPMNFDDPTYQAQIARQDVSILGMYPGLAPGGKPLNTSLQAIKAKNPNTLLFLYAMLDCLGVAQANDAFAPLRTKVTSMKWWLYSDKSLSLHVLTPHDTRFGEINITQWAPQDSSGNNAVDYITRFFVNTNLTPNPAADGIFMDNTAVNPPAAGDWQRNGTILQPTDPKALSAFQAGYQRYYQLARSLAPGKFQIGNITEWAASGAAIPAGYVNMVDGGVMEGAIGKSWSVEGWAGWQVMMKQYNAIMAAVAEPKLIILNQWGDPTDYQSMRYGLGSTLLNDGYYSFTNTATSYHGVVWFDEFDAKLGQAQAIPTAAWKQGVWRRDFDNGIVLVNPKGNGNQTVTLETSYVKLQGTQDPAINNGQTVTTVTLKDRDGIILMRKNPVKRPAAPQKLTAGT